MCERHINRLVLARPQRGTWPATQARSLTRNPTGDLSVHRLALNLLSHTSQGYFLHKITKPRVIKDVNMKENSVKHYLNVRK